MSTPGNDSLHAVHEPAGRFSSIQESSEEEFPLGTSASEVSSLSLSPASVGEERSNASTISSPTALTTIDKQARKDVYVTVAESFGGISLADAMPRRKLKLEKLREEALAKNEPRRIEKKVEQTPASESLESMLKVHKSALERAQEAAWAADEPRGSRNGRINTSKYGENRHSDGDIAESGFGNSSLDDLLKKGYSKLEKEKMALERQQTTELTSRPRRKSRLQLEREAAERMAAQKVQKDTEGSSTCGSDTENEQLRSEGEETFAE